MDHSGLDDHREEVFMCSEENQETPFDVTIGHIEDIIIGAELEIILKEFMEKYYTVFEDTDENKLEYMAIFHEYHGLLEQYLESELHKRQPDFSVAKFAEQFSERQSDLDGEVFQMLLSLTDFVLFKELMLDYKKNKTNPISGFNDDLVVTSLSKLNLSSR